MPASDEDSSSIATDDLSTSIATEDLSSLGEEEGTEPSDYEMSGRASELDVERADSADQEALLGIHYDEKTGQFVKYDDPHFIETDSAFSFPGRISASEEEVANNILAAESPVPSSIMDDMSTIVGSTATATSSGGDTLTDLSVSRAGMRREEEEVEESEELKKKKLGGLVKRFKKRVMKKA